jgi:hypothetical protein
MMLRARSAGRSCPEAMNRRNEDAFSCQRSEERAVRPIQWQARLTLLIRPWVVATGSSDGVRRHEHGLQGLRKRLKRYVPMKIILPVRGLSGRLRHQFEIEPVIVAQMRHNNIIAARN